MGWLLRKFLSGVRECLGETMRWVLATGVFIAIVGGLGNSNRIIHWSTVTVFLVGPLVVCGFLLRHGLQKRCGVEGSTASTGLARGAAALAGLVFLVYYSVAIWMAVRL